MLNREWIEKIKSSELSRRMVNGAFWSFTGTAIGKFCVLLAGIFCARILGKELFGEFGMVRSTINMFIILGTAGIGVTATRYISLYKKTDHDHIASICLLSNRFAQITAFIVAAIVLLFASMIATHTLNAPYLEHSIQFGALLLLISVLNGAQNGILVGLEDFRSISVNTLIGSLCESVFMLIGAYYWQVEGAILGFGIGVIALYLANKQAIKRNYVKHNITIQGEKIRKEDWNIVLSYSLPAALSALTITPAFWAIRSLLVYYNDYESLGSFEAADQWRIIILFIPTAISQITLPILSSLLNDKSRFRNMLMINVGLIAITSILLSIGITFSSKYIMAWYGTSFAEDSWPLILLAASTVFSSISNVIEMSIYSFGKMWTNLLLNIIWALLLIGFSWYFLQKGYAASALALAVLLAYALKLCYMSLYLKYGVKPTANK